jgi:molecular chaperone DnaK
MKYVGIDLGTTNSAISTYDGENTQIYKSPEQYDVTPSVIYYDKRGNKYVGSRAYNNSVRNEDNSAMLFKRFMGTSTKINIKGLNKEMTPEECSAEVLKTLYGYLPEEVRNDENTGTVITVPAAFNQMQKDATMEAAKLAGIGSVALMQEPVAAVMSVMKSRKSDGLFLIYDLGGGTLDVAIAESISGKVNLLAHGGIAMCGGRDFDRILFDNVVKPWLLKNFNLPDDFASNPQYKTLRRMALWALEKAKIELSARDEAIISLPETELNVNDLDNEEIYIDIPLSRDTFDQLIHDKVSDSIEAVRESLEKAGLAVHDVERIVFVGGPTQYKPLRDKVSFELGIAQSTDVNPMTAVSEGAAIFAESIDWSQENRSRKSSKGSLKSNNLDIQFNYIARTPSDKAKLVVKTGNSASDNIEIQIDNLDSGWTSGKMPLNDGISTSLPLSKSGDNTFKVFIFDANGMPVSLNEDTIIITKTAASIDAIPASSSIGVEARDKIGGKLVLDYLVKEGDKLPIKGSKTFKSEESLKAGSPGSIRFKLWEGEISDPIDDNRYVGTFEIRGTDFDSGVIPAGADLVLEYEMLDSGAIVLEVSVPSIGNSFHSGRNFYSRESGQIDYSQASQLVEAEVERIENKIDTIEENIYDSQLEEARKKIHHATTIDKNSDPESAKQAMDDIQDAKKILAKVRKNNLKEIRKIELDGVVDFFENTLKEFAKPVDVNKFNNLLRSAQRAIENNSKDFDGYISEIKNLNFDILWRQDWFVVNQFKNMIENPYQFSDQTEFSRLSELGLQAMQNDDINQLRQIVAQLAQIQIGGVSMQDDIFSAANIIRGH